jgi:toxin ParE1/3/4
VSAGARRWTVRLTATAQADFQDIIRWTSAQFGPGQAQVYAGTLSAALEALANGPRIGGARARDDIAKGLFTLHVARGGRKGRHFVMFRIGDDPDREVIDVLRLLHDVMDLPRHLPPINERE